MGGLKGSATSLSRSEMSISLSVLSHSCRGCRASCCLHQRSPQHHPTHTHTQSRPSTHGRANAAGRLGASDSGCGAAHGVGAHCCREWRVDVESDKLRCTAYPCVSVSTPVGSTLALTRWPAVARPWGVPGRERAALGGGDAVPLGRRRSRAGTRPAMLSCRARSLGDTSGGISTAQHAVPREILATSRVHARW